MQGGTDPMSIDVDPTLDGNQAVIEDGVAIITHDVEMEAPPTALPGADDCMYTFRLDWRSIPDPHPSFPALAAGPDVDVRAMSR